MNSAFHEFVKTDPRHTYCQNPTCRKHYSDPTHHQRGQGDNCPNGFACSVCDLPLIDKSSNNLKEKNNVG